MESFRSKTPGGGNPHIAPGRFRFYYNCMKTDQITRLQRIVLSQTKLTLLVMGSSMVLANSALLAQNANTNTLPLTKPWLQGFRTFI